MPIQPYLFFDGRCQEALDFYREALGAELLTAMRSARAPSHRRPGVLPPGWDQKIMHASLRVGDALVNGVRRRAAPATPASPASRCP